MRSRKKPSKIRILIAPGKSIASAMIHELAMLFCHAGSDVFYAFREGSESWATPEAAQAISGNPPLTQTNQPGWLKSRRPYDLAIFFADSEKEIDDLSSDKPSNPILAHIKSKARFIELLVTRDFVSKNNVSGINPLIRRQYLPDRFLDLYSFYEKLFSSQIRLLNARKELADKPFKINDLSKDCNQADKAMLFELLNALIDAGFAPSDKQEARFVIDFRGSELETSRNDSEKQTPQLRIEFYNAVKPDHCNCSNKNVIQAIATANSIEVRKAEQTRLIPSVEGQDACSRFADFVKYELQVSSKGKCEQ